MSFQSIDNLKQSSLFETRKVRLILVAAPSGAGKSTFVEKLCREDPRFEDVITYTTRPMRPHEKQGQPYHFISRDEFETRVKQGFFVEWALVHGHYYGSSWESLHQVWAKGRVVIMDIDVQGWPAIAKRPWRVSERFLFWPLIRRS